MILTITVEFTDGNGVEMETNLNRAIDDLSSALKRKGLVEMDLSAKSFPDLRPVYKLTITKL